jgi:hypothetical protein
MTSPKGKLKAVGLKEFLATDLHRPKPMTKSEALEKYETRWWVGKSPAEIVAFQLFEPKLCMPFGEFHGAVESALGRGVQTIEFGMNVEGLKREFLAKQKFKGGSDARG